MVKACERSLHDEGALDLFLFGSFGFRGGQLLGQEGRRLPVGRQGGHDVVVQRAVLHGRRGRCGGGRPSLHVRGPGEWGALRGPCAVHYYIFIIMPEVPPPFIILFSHKLIS